MDGRPMVTKTDFRFLHTLENMGPSPEPNLTVLYSEDLPDALQALCREDFRADQSVQYENDDVMQSGLGRRLLHLLLRLRDARPARRCSSSARARTWPSACSTRINGGVDVKTREQVGPAYRPITSECAGL